MDKDRGWEEGGGGGRFSPNMFPGNLGKVFRVHVFRRQSFFNLYQTSSAFASVGIANNFFRMPFRFKILDFFVPGKNFHKHTAPANRLLSRQDC